MTIPEFTRLVQDYAVKRRAFLVAHDNNFAAPETSIAYVVATDAWEAVSDEIEHYAMVEPERFAALFVNAGTPA